MAKKIWMTLGVMGMAVILGLGIYHSNASQAEPTLSLNDIKELVNSQYPGTITELELENGASGATYYVEIMKDEMEYELKIDGHSGEVITLKEKHINEKKRANIKETIDVKEQEKEKAEKAEEEKAAKEQAEKKQKEKVEAEKEQAAKEQQEKEQMDREKQTQQGTTITKKETKEQKEKPEKQLEPKKEKQTKKTVIDRKKAIAIALEQFAGNVEEVELDEEDGRLIYEIEIEADEEEAKLEIDAYTGEIIVIEIEDD